MSNVLDRLVWARHELAPKLSMREFGRLAGLSHATLSAIVRRWQAKQDKDDDIGRSQTWRKLAAYWKIDPVWLIHGVGDPVPGVRVNETDLVGLAEKEFAHGFGGTPVPGSTEIAEPPPQPRKGAQIPDDVRMEAAIFLMARTKPDGERFSRLEIWAGFRNIFLQDDDDVSDARVVAGAVQSAILGNDNDPPTATRVRH